VPLYTDYINIAAKAPHSPETDIDFKIFIGKYINATYSEVFAFNFDITLFDDVRHCSPSQLHKHSDACK